MLEGASYTAQDVAPIVFVVDDDQQVCIALSRLLSAANYQVRVFESAERFLEQDRRETPGCVLLDMCMPGVNGLNAQRLLIASGYQRQVIFLSGNSDIQSCVAAMKAGAVDFLTKPIDSTRLFAAVDTAIELDRAEREERTMRQVIEQDYRRLTHRERQVMEQVVVGRLNKQIAADLGLHEKTVKVHRGRVMSKMRAHSIAELVHLSLKRPALKQQA